MALIVALGAAPLPTTGRPGAPELIIVALGVALAGFLWYADLIRPGSFRRRTPARPEHAAAIPWPIWLLAAVVTYLALLTTAGLVGALVGVTPGVDPDLRQQAIVGVAAYTVAATAGAALVAFFARAIRPPNSGLRVRATDLLAGLVLFALTAPIILAVGVLSPAIYGLLTGIAPDPVAHTQLRMILDSRADPWIWALVLTAALGAPIVEELTYRVFLQTSLLTLTRSHWAAILITSLLFTAVHIGSVPIYAMPVLFTLSVAIGAAYERTARLGVPIVMHAAFNAANLAVTLAAS